MDYDDLNDLTLATAEKIEADSGRELTVDDRLSLNDVLSAWLNEHGIELKDEYNAPV